MSAKNNHRKLVFHVGNHKAGSTTIQSAFALQQVHIPRKSIVYTSRLNHNHLVPAALSFAKTGGSKRSDQLTKPLAKTAKALAKKNYDYAVFSAESFEFVKPAILAKTLDTFMLPHVDEHVVVSYVRPHAARILSTHAENIKIGATQKTLAEFHQMRATGPNFRFAPRLAAWQQEFGANFVARPMVRDVLKNQSLLDDFVQTAFGPGTEFTVDQIPSANESLSLEDLALLARLQSRLMNIEHIQKQDRHAIGWTFLINSAERRPAQAGTKLALDKALAEAIRETYLDDARALDQGIFASTPIMERELDKAVDTAIAKPQPLEAEAHFSSDTLRAVDLYTDMFVAMLSEDTLPMIRTRLKRQRLARLHGELVEPTAPVKSVAPRKRQPWPRGRGYRGRLNAMLKGPPAHGR